MKWSKNSNEFSRETETGSGKLTWLEDLDGRASSFSLRKEEKYRTHVLLLNNLEFIIFLVWSSCSHHSGH